MPQQRKEREMNLEEFFKRLPEIQKELEEKDGYGTDYELRQINYKLFEIGVLWRKRNET